MYGLIWRLLPGPTWVKAVLALLLVLAFVAVLFQWVFPWAATIVPFNNQTIDPATGATTSVSPTTTATRR